MWEEAQERFHKLTAKELKGSRPKRLDDVITELEAKYVANSSTELDIKKRTAKVIENVLKCIQLLGGIAAQGASMV